MNRKSLIAAVFAALMLFSITVPPAWAYFTAYSETEGVKTVSFSDDTTIVEPDVKDWVKHLVIRNTGDGAVFVRANAFAASKYELTASGSGWESTKRGDYWYYTEPVEPGAAAEELLVKISNVPEDVEYGDGFNVAVIYEAVPARYAEDGTLVSYYDEEAWSQDLVVVEE